VWYITKLPSRYMARPKNLWNKNNVRDEYPGLFSNLKLILTRSSKIAIMSASPYDLASRGWLAPNKMAPGESKASHVDSRDLNQ
jgi:hypothetical protein